MTWSYICREELFEWLGRHFALNILYKMTASPASVLLLHVYPSCVYRQAIIVITELEKGPLFKLYTTQTCGEDIGYLRPCLYGLGYPRQPSPRASLAELTFHLFLWKIQLTVYMRTRTRLGGARQLGWASCLVSAGRVTLSGGTTFSHIDTLARLPEARCLKLFPEPAILSNM